MTLYILTCSFLALQSLLIGKLMHCRRQMKKNIALAEERSNQVQAIAHLGLWEYHQKEDVLKWSENAYRIFGFEPFSVEPTIEHFLSLIHPEDAEEVRVNFGKTCEDCRSVSFRVIRNDQSIRHVYFNCTQAISGTDQPVIMQGVIQDITEIIETQQKAAVHEKRFDAVFNNSLDAITLINENGELICESPAFNNMLGFKQGEITGIKHAELVHSCDQDNLRAFLSELHDNPGVARYRKLRMKHKDGGYVWAEGKAVNLLHDHNVKAIVTSFRDVTRTLKTETSLKQSEINLRNILEHADVGYVLLDTQFNVMAFNTLAAKYASDTLRVIIKEGTYGISYFPVDKQKMMISLFQKALNGKSANCEVSYPGQDDAPVWYGVRIQGIQQADGRITGVIMSLTDITQRKLHDLQRARITADLVKRNKDHEQFAYMVSHNLRAPLTNIIGLCDLLQSHDIEEAIRKEFIHGMMVSAMKLDGVIIDMHAILSVKQGQEEKKEQVSMKRLLEDVKSNLLIPQDLEVKITGDFSQADGFYVIKAYLYSVFYNLLSNGIKYRREGVIPELSVQSRVSGGQLELLFSDNGQGIDMDRYGEKVFGLYNRFHPEKEGKGMGLFMTRCHAEALGGSISVESYVNRGSVFKVELPL